jgi:hypothetical protein
MKDPSRVNDGEQHVPTTTSEDGGALGEAAMAGATGRSHPPRTYPHRAVISRYIPRIVGH